jgi:hypothetical protein
MFHRLVLMDENYIFTLGAGDPEVSGIEFASRAIIGRRDQAVAALLLARASDPSLHPSRHVKLLLTQEHYNIPPRQAPLHQSIPERPPYPPDKQTTYNSS